MFQRVRTRTGIPTTLLLLLSSLALVALVVSACGGKKGKSSADAQKVIDQTFSGNKKVNSGKLDLSMTAKIDASGATAAQFKKPVSIKLGGPFEQDPGNEDALPKFDFKLTASAGGQTFTAGAVSTSDEGFISYQGTAYKVDSDTFGQFKRNFESQQKSSQDQNQPGLGALGVDPKKWVKNASGEGTETVGGAETDHVSADIDVSAFVADLDNLLRSSGKLKLTKQQQAQLPKELSAETKKQIQDSIEEAKIDIWTGKTDKILRKFQLKLKFRVPDSLKSRAQGLNGGEIDLMAQISDVNQPQTITTPQNAKPLSELQSLIGGVGGLGGSSGVTPPTGSTGGTNGTGAGTPNGPSSENAQKYLDCIRKANGDQAAATKCSSILTK